MKAAGYTPITTHSPWTRSTSRHGGATRCRRRIGAAGLCRTDLHIQEGQWAEKSGVELPYTLGHENAGWIHEVGSGSRTSRFGDSVIVHLTSPVVSAGPCRRGDDMHCINGRFPGISEDGGFADSCSRAPGRDQARPVTRAKEIAALADAGLTAIHASRRRCRAFPARGGVIGAGGLGHIGSSAGGDAPAEIIVVDPPSRRSSLRADRRRPTVRVDGSHVDTVRELTDGLGAEVISISSARRARSRTGSR